MEKDFLGGSLISLYRKPPWKISRKIYSRKQKFMPEYD